MDSKIHICAKCSFFAKTCCYNNAIPPTIEDIERLTTLGHRKKDFLIPVKLTKEESLELGYKEHEWPMKEEPEGWTRIGADYYELNTKKKEDGACVFLDMSKGCTLGEDRFTICKLYPFWFNKKGVLEFQDNHCFMKKMGFSHHEIMGELSENIGKLREYQGKFVRDYTENKLEHRKLIEEMFEIMDKEDQGKLIVNIQVPEAVPLD